MNKQEIIEKLQELGIFTDNAYPKSSFMKEGNAYSSFFERELKNDFYFYNTFDKKIYKVPKPESLEELETNIFSGGLRYIIPLDKCTLVWEDKEYIELPDVPYNSMTLRQYACIHLKIPESGLPWLDNLINKAI